MFATLKLIHVGAALLTIGGFLLRGYWMMIHSKMLQRRWVRVLPHIVDSIFLLSGISMIMALHLRLMQNDWLLMKIGALIVYIVLGTIALRRGRTRRIKVTAFVLAVLTFTYIVGIALTRSTASWLAFFSTGS